ncbi:acyl-protein thioesterase [Aureococcus anophagefferens]|nr:acyl-protein thioesterase [Aureococcus anophagefferens]
MSAAATTATCQKAGVIFLHGLGDTPAGWSDIKHQMAQLNPKLASPEITWDFPRRRPTAGQGVPDGASKATPCLWGHGAMDDKVLFPHQKIGVDLLTARGVTVDASNHPMGHSAHPEELAKLAAFLAGILFP